MGRWKQAAVWFGHLAVAATASGLAGGWRGARAAALTMVVLVGLHVGMAGSRWGRVPLTLLLIGGCWAWTPWAAAGATLIWAIGALLRANPLAGSSLAAATLPVGVWLLAHPGAAVLALSVLASGLVVWRQREWWREFGL